MIWPLSTGYPNPGQQLITTESGAGILCGEILHRESLLGCLDLSAQGRQRNGRIREADRVTPLWTFPKDAAVAVVTAQNKTFFTPF